jgi:predicted Fe-Mo cluster-binding NifX family protein
MRVVVSSSGGGLDGPVSPAFGRCPTFLFVETDSMEFEEAPNPGVDAPGGAGIKAAQFVTASDVAAVITGRLGPNAADVLQSAGTPVFLFAGGTVRKAVEAFTAGELAQALDRRGTGEDRAPTASSRDRQNTLERHLQPREGDQVVRIAFSADDSPGLTSTVSPHFGRCPYYVLVDLLGDKPANVRTVENPYYEGHQPGEVPRFIRSHGAEVIITGGMGRRALSFFETEGVEVVTGGRGTVEHSLRAYLCGRLNGADPCRGSSRHAHGGHDEAPSMGESREHNEIDRLRAKVEALEQQLTQALTRVKGVGGDGPS